MSTKKAKCKKCNAYGWLDSKGVCALCVLDMLHKKGSCQCGLLASYEVDGEFYCFKCYDKLSEDRDLPSHETMKDRSDRLGRMVHRLREFATFCEMRRKFVDLHSSVTANPTLGLIEQSQSAVLTQTYETIRHIINTAHIEGPKQSSNCMACNYPLDDKFVFCPKCGAYGGVAAKP